MGAFPTNLSGRPVKDVSRIRSGRLNTEKASTIGIESVWVALKRGFYGTHRSFSEYSCNSTWTNPFSG